MAKKLFKLTPLGALVGAIKGKKKAPEPVPAPEAKGGPIVTPLGGTAPAALPPRKRKGRGATIVGNGLNETLGG